MKISVDDAMKSKDFEFIEDRLHALMNQCNKKDIHGQFTCWCILVIAMRAVFDNTKSKAGAETITETAMEAALVAHNEPDVVRKEFH